MKKLIALCRRYVKPKIVAVSLWVSKTLTTFFGWLLKPQNLMAVATFALAGVTVWLACETRRLGEIDLGPNIALSDVEIELVDASPQPVKQRSWREGELLDKKGGTTIAITEKNVLLKFVNTGKRAGYIELTNFEELASVAGIDATSLPDGVYRKLTEPRLVPPGVETGWTYGLNVANASYQDFAPILAKVLYLHYRFQIYDEDANARDSLRVDISCIASARSEEGGYQDSCEPVLYKEG